MNITVTATDIRMITGAGTPPSLEHGQPGFNDSSFFVGDASKTPIEFENKASARAYVDAAVAAVAPSTPTRIVGGFC